MAKATYYSEILEPKEFDILAENKDGTLDIGDAKSKTVVVGKVSVVDQPKPGCVTVAKAAAPAAKSDPDAKK